jgi:hypothetical protein
MTRKGSIKIIIFSSLAIGLAAIIFYIFVFVQYDSIEDIVKVTIKNDLAVVGETLKKYKVENGEYPETLKFVEPYFTKMIRDPWGDLYLYRTYNNCFELKCCLSKRDRVERLTCE